MLDKDQVVDKLMHSDIDILREMCYFSYKDQYGTKGQHLLKYTVSQLISWWISHYDWNEKDQVWETIFPFDNYDYSDRANEAEYYHQFG